MNRVFLALVLAVAVLGVGLAQSVSFPGPGAKGYAAAGDPPWVTAFTPGTSRNDFAGCVGFFFNVAGSSITVTELGRWKYSGNTGTHSVRIVNGAGSTVISANVDLTTGSVGTFVWASCTPTVLTASSGYYCMSQEVNAGDTWSHYVTGMTTAAYATLNNAAYQAGCTGAATSDTAGQGYVIPNFKAH